MIDSDGPGFRTRVKKLIIPQKCRLNFAKDEQGLKPPISRRQTAAETNAINTTLAATGGNSDREITPTLRLHI